MKQTAKVFIWLGMIFQCVLIYPIVIGILALKKIDEAQSTDELGLDEIVAGYYTPNVASGKIQLKAGLKPYKTIKDMIVWYETGKPCDGVVCKITRQEYLDNPTYKNLQIKVKDTKLGIDKEKEL